MTCHRGVTGFFQCCKITTKIIVIQEFFPIFYYFIRIFNQFSYFCVPQLSKYSNFDGSCFAGKVNISINNEPIKMILYALELCN